MNRWRRCDRRQWRIWNVVRRGQTARLRGRRTEAWNSEITNYVLGGVTIPIFHHIGVLETKQVARQRQLGAAKIFGATFTDKCTQLTIGITGNATILTVEYKIMLQAEQAENFPVCTLTYDILRNINRKWNDEINKNLLGARRQFEGSCPLCPLLATCWDLLAQQ